MKRKKFGLSSPKHITQVPIELVRLKENSFHIIVKTEIDGVRGDMIIDTGASITVIDQNKVAEKTPEIQTNRIQSGSVTGQIQEVRIFKPAYLKIRNLKFKNKQLAGIDLQYVNEMYDEHLKRNVLGLLGCDFCVKHQARIDFKNKRLILHT